MLLTKLKLLAPGTKLRKALDDILIARFGALIVFVENQCSESLFQGGFRFEIPFTPEKLYELAKMDGAILLDQDASKILGANVHLVPDPNIATSETGMRHRTAERIARQTGALVLAVSSRRNLISVYWDNNKYVLKDIKLLISRVTQAVATLEKYRANFDKMMSQVDVAEFHNRLELRNVVEVITKGVEILKIQDQIEPYVIELGIEGSLAKMQLDEIVGDMEELLGIFIMDYHSNEVSLEESRNILMNLKKLKEIGPLVLARSIGYDIANIGQLDDFSITTKGYRFLKYAVRIPMVISSNLVKSFKTLSQISAANLEDLKAVDGIGHKRALTILETINSIKRGMAINI